MNYKSFLTRDYKNIAQADYRHKRVAMRGRHLLYVVCTLCLSASIFTFFSLDASAKRQVELNNNDAQNKLVLAIDIPPAQTPIDSTGTQADEQWLEVKVKKGDSLSTIFKRHDLDASELYQIMQLGKSTQRLRNVQPGQSFRIQIDDDRAIQNLIYDITKLETLIVKRENDEFSASYHHRDVDVRTHHASAVVNSSLFETGRSVGLSDSLTMEIAHIFGWDVDFALDIRQGDQFTVIYEEHYLDGSKVNEGPILAAEFINQGKSYKAIRYTDANGRSDYYSPNGLSMRKAFLRTPVDFRRISSRFGNRKHPVLNRIRMHKGVDYAAPRGTPVKASGDGKIIHKGRKGGYGNTIILKHGGRYSTLYAHMSSYRQGMYVGKYVKQGQTIGYVGSTGRATGPHLHYEFRVNGVHRNPLTIRLPNANPIDRKFKQDFVQHAEAMVSQINMYRETSIALNHQ